MKLRYSNCVGPIFNSGFRVESKLAFSSVGPLDNITHSQTLGTINQTPVTPESDKKLLQKKTKTKTKTKTNITSLFSWVSPLEGQVVLPSFGVQQPPQMLFFYFFYIIPPQMYIFYFFILFCLYHSPSNIIFIMYKDG